MNEYEEEGDVAMPASALPHQHESAAELEYLESQLSRIDDFQIVAEVFKQLGDTSRVRIFWLLCHCEECVINISAMMNMSSPAVSHHLRPLKNRGLIVSRRVGKEVYYKAADTQQSQLLHHMIEQVMEITCPQ
jgi:DNA-binding transcriptional ArsR family regulator